MLVQQYDCAIIGGGPAGESAAIYLARFNRSVLVLDRGGGRTCTHELNENYLGFPFGIKARKLWELGKTQAERFGAHFTQDEVKSITVKKVANSVKNPIFHVKTSNRDLEARSIIIATGVTDLYPNIQAHEKYLGKSLFWCITCDGYKTRGKKVTLVGDSDEAACTALQFLNYTDQVRLITNYPPGKAEISALWRDRLAQAQVPLLETVIHTLHGDDGWVETIETVEHQHCATDYIFNMQGAIPNNSLATQLGVKVNSEGYIETSDEQRTNVPFVYAAGDVTRMFSHQIVTAVHEGSMAAQAANYDLYRPEQRMSDIVDQPEEKMP